MTKLTPQNQQSNVSTDKEEFKPTPHMIVWLDTVIKTPTDVVDEISRVSGVDESTYYNWLKKDGFIEWFERERNKKLRAHAWRLDNMGLKQARRDHRYWESMQKRVNNLGGDFQEEATFTWRKK
jgi:hypothetical protein